MKNVKIKDLARRYGINEKDMTAELIEQGIDVDKKKGEFDAEMLELVEDYLNDLYGEKKKIRTGKKETSKEPGKEISMYSPIIVKDLAEALDKKPNVIIADLMKFGELANINQAISDTTAKKLCKSYGYELILGKSTSEEEAP